MRHRTSKNEQIRLIMECRKSGLSDYQWCKQNDINPANFYNWINRLKKSGYELPDPADNIETNPILQEVVKLDVIESTTESIFHAKQNTLHLSSKVAAEICVGNATIRLYNDATAQFIETLLRTIGGFDHAW